MQNESTEDEDKLKKTVADIEAQDGTSDAQRAVYLGLAIWDLVGRSGLKEAVKAFSKDLQAGNFTRSTLIAKQMHPLTLSQSITTLPKFAGLLAGVTDEAKLSKIKSQIDSFANVAGVQDDFVKLQIGLLIAATYNDEVLKEAVETILSGQ